MVTILVFRCSHMQSNNMLCFYTSGLLEKPVEGLNNLLLETWSNPVKTAHCGLQTGRCRWNHKLALAPNRVLNLIIHLLFILLSGSQYQCLERGRCSRCFVTRGVTLNCCQRSWSHCLHQQIWGWLMFTEWLNLSESMLLKKVVHRGFFSCFQKWSQGDNLSNI